MFAVMLGPHRMLCVVVTCCESFPGKEEAMTGWPPHCRDFAPRILTAGLQTLQKRNCKVKILVMQTHKKKQGDGRAYTLLLPQVLSQVH